MDWTSRHHPLWRWLLLVCALATALPLWSAAHLPFTDLPQHAAAIATLRHWFDPAWKSQEYFTLALGQTQYLLYYVLGAVLAVPFATAERANLVLLTLIAIAYPYSMRALLRALRGDESLALFGCTLFWSQSLLIGFFNYVAAMPLMLWGLSLAVRDAREPRLRTTVLLGGCAVALFYLHTSAFVFFAPAAALASIALPRFAPLREWPRRLAWTAPIAGLSVVFLAASPVVHPETVGWRQHVAIQFEETSAALKNLPDALLDIWRGPYDEYALLALIGAAALLAWPQRREEDATAQERGVVAAWAVFAAALFLFFPIAIGWLWQLNERYALVLALLLPLLLRPARGWRGAVPLGLVAATGLFSALVATHNIRAFDREVGAFDEVLARAQPGKRLVGMIFEQNSRVAKFSAFLQFQAYYRARYGGVASFSFAELPQSPLRYRPENAPPPHPAGWEWHAGMVRNDYDGPYYDYVLVHGSVNPFAGNPPGPHWRIAAQADRWTLFEKQP